MKKLDSNLSPNAKRELEKDLKGESVEKVLSLLTSLLEDELEKKVKESESSLSYEKAAWSEKQADNLGYRRCIRDILKVLKDSK